MSESPRRASHQVPPGASGYREEEATALEEEELETAAALSLWLEGVEQEHVP